MHLKSDYLSIMHTFAKYVKIHFSVHIKHFRTDNALEFSTADCKEFYAKLGILHQTSCPYRPQQNSRVERKHRSILEIARSLRFQSGVPICYWGECVMTAIHLLNILPTTALDNKISFEVLYKKSADYEHLKVFGCFGFDATSKSNDKFDVRGVPCIFLGYPASKKGYKMLNFLTREIFVTRDVRFIESVFPMNDQTDKYVLPLPAPMGQQMSSKTTYDDDEIVADTPATAENDQHSAPTEPVLRRSTRIHQKPQWLNIMLILLLLQLISVKLQILPLMLLSVVSWLLLLRKKIQCILNKPSKKSIGYMP